LILANQVGTPTVPQTWQPARRGRLRLAAGETRPDLGIRLQSNRNPSRVHQHQPPRLCRRLCGHRPSGRSQTIGPNAKGESSSSSLADVRTPLLRVSTTNRPRPLMVRDRHPMASPWRSTSTCTTLDPHQCLCPTSGVRTCRNGASSTRRGNNNGRHLDPAFKTRYKRPHPMARPEPRLIPQRRLSLTTFSAGQAVPADLMALRVQTSERVLPIRWPRRLDPQTADTSAMRTNDRNRRRHLPTGTCCLIWVRAGELDPALVWTAAPLLST
jgi:hypothetical protein